MSPGRRPSQGIFPFKLKKTPLKIKNTPHKIKNRPIPENIAGKIITHLLGER